MKKQLLRKKSSNTSKTGSKKSNRLYKAKPRVKKVKLELKLIEGNKDKEVRGIKDDMEKEM